MAVRLPLAVSIPQISIGGRHIGGFLGLQRLDAAQALGLVEFRGALH